MKNRRYHITYIQVVPFSNVFVWQSIIIFSFLYNGRRKTMYMKYCFESIRYIGIHVKYSRNTKCVVWFLYFLIPLLSNWRTFYITVCVRWKRRPTLLEEKTVRICWIVSIISRATAWCYFSLTVSRRFKPRGREEAVVEATIETFAPLFRRNLLEDILRSPENIFRGGNGSWTKKVLRVGYEKK